MTKREAAIVSAYTGYLNCDFKDFHAYVEEIMGRPIQILELPALEDEIREKSKKDFIDIQIKEEPPEWLYHTPFEGRSLVDFDAVEKALGFRLFGWQKDYILSGCAYASRRTGKTTAEILHQLLSVNEEPIDFSRPAPSKRIAIVRQDFRDIWEKLRADGIEMRQVFWSEEDKKKYEIESMNKFNPYKYDGEVFAKYEAEHANYVCSDCSQCRYDDANGTYYCRRSFTTIDRPEEMSTCDDFEKGE